MNLPNKLTLTRIILVPVFMVFVSLTQIGTEDFNPTWYLVAGIIFAAASFTAFSSSIRPCPRKNISPNFACGRPAT